MAGFHVAIGKCVGYNGRDQWQRITPLPEYDRLMHERMVS